MYKNNIALIFLAACLAACGEHPGNNSVNIPREERGHHAAADLNLNTREYFEAPGINVLAFSNAPGGLFYDAKTSGVEIIQRGERIATNGDLRLLHTPEQWDGMGRLIERRADPEANRIETRLEYPEHNLSYRVDTRAQGDKVEISVHLDKPLPEKLEGKAGFNLEFLPAAYFGKTYLMDGRGAIFPRHPRGPMRFDRDGRTEPLPLARGTELVLSPENPDTRVTLRELSGENQLLLFDGRNKAQNGWFVVRSLIPAARTGRVIHWELEITAEPGWLRTPVITYSQVGYHPQQPKTAVIELDANDTPKARARLLRLTADGETNEAFNAPVNLWGNYLRYQYATFDFSAVTRPGLYRIEYGSQLSGPFPIDTNVHRQTWQPTLDIFLPVQMDHMEVREAYRIWHGRSHLDDALQAPPNYEHFDLYAHGPETDSRFEPFEHIPGLAIGGWYDAGDYDIRTQSQYHTVRDLVRAWESFRITRDNTTVSQSKRLVQIHRPDGVPDILQQIEHGTLALIAQHRALGHAIPGIVAAHLYQYPHLGDGATKTDNRVYRATLDPFASERRVGKMYLPSTAAPPPERRVLSSDGNHSGEFDDRWAFTSNTSALNYGSAAALAAASRALRGYNDDLAKESLETAVNVWEYESHREPNRYRYGNTTGGRLEEEQLGAAVELLAATQNPRYAQAVRQLLPQLHDRFATNAITLAQALPLMDQAYAETLQQLTRAYREQIREYERENPFGVPITRGGWAGAGSVIDFGNTNYWLHRYFPHIVEKDLVFRSLDYILGQHPGSNLSLVSAVGVESKLVAYGSNRADFSFIPGGVVPGVLVLPPDFPENKENWPFFWGQNEYVITVGASYLFLANAVQSLLEQQADESTL
ncbi:glycoside hydrolase family 9 protein [Microbulbifer thermotolerans]|uniref:glycoside hydrolase family 9 protein n=1 Tax=Microbulbifer thermotolerans TaxID=252514 RepID=UPI0009EEDE33|nr:glycoside hydrolase family 9 protein [Microbulbifer thermotolerans]